MINYKAGIIGCGNIAGGYNVDCKSGASLTHACSYQQIDNVDLIAASDISQSRRTNFANKWKISNVFSTELEMLNSLDLDIISICSPTEYHIDAFKAISESKTVKGIFCEKPLAHNLNAAYEILDISKKFNVSLNYFRRWNSKLTELLNDLKEGKYGELKYIKASYTKGLKVNGSHLIDLLYSVLGMPIDVHSYYIHKSIDKDPGVDFSLSFKGQIDANFQHIPKVPYVLIDMDFFTEKGRVSMVQRGQKIEWFESIKDNDYNAFNKLEFVSSETTDWSNCPTRALEELIEVMRNGGQTSCTPQDGVNVYEICEKIIDY